MPSTTSPPGGWPSGWPPGRRTGTSPAAWSTSPETGGISQGLKTHLRVHVRTPGYPDQLQAARLLRYCAERGPNVEPISPDFGTACDQIDRADVMLAALRDRTRQGLTHPEQAWPETDGPQILALAGRDPDTGTVSLILDATTANIAMHAIAAHAAEREAHVREVERYGQTLPEGSYGRRSRQAIATREARVAARLRAIERAHRLATERDVVFRPSGPTTAPRTPQHEANRGERAGAGRRVNPPAIQVALVSHSMIFCS